jgi:8-oxo-dGTP diphosphatase
MPVKVAIICENCGHSLSVYKNPLPTVDIIIEYAGGIVLIKRKNPPPGWALPGGFVDYGESVETAAAREAMEETGLTLEGLTQMRVYSDPGRDERFHTITTVFMATGKGRLMAQDDAAEARVFAVDNLPTPLAFDHAQIIADYQALRRQCPVNNT